ncbi:TetR/AcrR family transcriptional regulator [Dyadobacter sp. CY261]|uniref:TetR/AcrR family transcriptional regulator n=1 Tax=Dyadobacter sp. CY261 TaxID=2907203 RepID=UPI00286D9BFD|nr:TetR/AcrR family transcriptional regulator [Dyadobacter sp. CY261]
MRNITVRESILKAAARLFYQQGYSNTGINQIIEQADIAKSSLYQHFKSKEELLMAYLQLTGAESLARLVAASQHGASPKQKVLAIFDYLAASVTNESFHGCHFLNIVYEMPHDALRVRQQVKLQKESVRDLFRDILQPLQNEALASEIYTLFEGALIGHKVHNDPWPVFAARAVVEKLL